MSHQHCLCCGDPLEKRGVCDFCLRLYRPELTSERERIVTDNARLKQDIDHARQQLWMLDEEDETFRDGVEGVRYRILGLRNEIKELELTLREATYLAPPS